MHLDVVIPTKQRLNKLYNCVVSVLTSDWGDNKICVKAVFSDPAELEVFRKFSLANNIITQVIADYRVPSFWNHYLTKSKADVLLCLNDDCLFYPDTVTKLSESFQTHFPDYDGVIGVCQANGPQEQCLDSAFCAIGLKYADRFPERQVYCPDYYRFWADNELGIYAKSIKRFVFDSLVKIKHLHPSFTGETPDETHYKTRKDYLLKDKEIYQTRRDLNLLWGESFITLKESENATL